VVRAYDVERWLQRQLEDLAVVTELVSSR
jgi:hypothetical protein